MKEFLTYVVEQLVDRPSEAVLREENREGTRCFTLELPPSEVGKIIGKQGHTIRAIRHLLSVAVRHGERVAFEIVEPGSLSK